MRDVFLVLRFGQPDEVVEATFAVLAAELGSPLRPVLPWVGWASVDGDLSLIRLTAAAPTGTARPTLRERELAVSDAV
jgi:hypothetical protein